jgi:NAD(P)H-hydrate epimerase
MTADSGEVALTRAQAREVDRIAIEELGIPGRLLMEHAGLLAALRLLELPWKRAGRVAILCGRGNNAGDGYVVARVLHSRGVAVRLLEAGPTVALPDDAAANRALVQQLGLELAALDSFPTSSALEAELSTHALLVDALLGTGFHGSVRAPLDAWIHAANQAKERHSIPIAALDLPSGLDADDGAPSNATIRADWTLTFVAAKVGFRRQGAKAWTGQVDVIPIGTPPALLERVLALKA